MIKIFIILLSVLLLSSCGDDSSNKKETLSMTVSSELQGKYKAHLRPLNTSVNGWLPSGAAEVEATQDLLSVTTYLDDDAKVLHIQSIHTGSQCPTLANDSNKDGYIDIVEAMSAAGPVMIPLDGDISSESEGEGAYPIGKAFTYNKSARLDEVMTDYFSKSQSRSAFNLEGRVVLIHGTSDINRVPESVQTINGQPRNITVPIGCGILKRR